MSARTPTSPTSPSKPARGGLWQARRLALGAVIGLLAAILGLGLLSWRSESEPDGGAMDAALTSTAATASPGPTASDGSGATSPAPGPSADAVARGQYLVRAGNCMACHTERGGAPWAGGRGIETPFGTVYAGNLTPDPTGLGAWSADDFWRALHRGRSRDGRMLYPAFPYTHYTRVSRADADAMYAFLRTVPPVSRENRAHDLRWPVNTQLALGLWRALYFRPGVQREDPARDASWNRGAYLVQGLGHCSACHSARNALGASEVLDLSGGMIPMQAWYAPSLSAPNEASVADWTQQEVVQLLATGRTERASTLGPMAEVVLHSTQHLSPRDLSAMATFLRAIPPSAPTASPRQAPVPPQVAERGARIYEKHCAQCHGNGGEGVPGAYPRLAGNRMVTMPVTANLVQVVIHGGFTPSTAGNPRPYGMPPFALVLSDADVAAVLTYLRSAWGNQAGPVSELDVAQQRSIGR